MPPFLRVADARGRQRFFICIAALGYSAGHCWITVYGCPYTRLVAGSLGFFVGALVLFALLWLHAQAERETSDTAEGAALHRAAQFIRDRRASGGTPQPRSVPHS